MGAAGGEAQAGMKQLAESSLARLRNWDLSPEQIAALVKTGEAKRTITFRSPVSGIVTEKKALQGMRFMPGEALYQVTDLSSVWVLADVFEQDIGLVKTGAKASVKINAYPDKTFDGKITYVYPTLKAETRTVPVRIELANPGQLLKPAMFSQVELQVGAKAPVLTVPDSAVIDSGTRRIVLVQLKEGRFEPREVKLGARSDNYVEVREGVKEGEQVVVAANFLIDAESNLKAAIGGLGTGAAPGRSARHRRRPPRRGPTQPARSPAGSRRPPGPGHRGQRRPQGRHRQPQSRRHPVAEMAGHDDGVQGRQSLAAEGPEAGRGGLVRIRRAPAGRMGDHDRSRRRRPRRPRRPAAQSGH